MGLGPFRDRPFRDGLSGHGLFGTDGVTPVARVSGYSICPGFPHEIATRSTSARLCVNLKFTGPVLGLFTPELYHCVLG
jgi:hypothetical protein